MARSKIHETLFQTRSRITIVTLGCLLASTFSCQLKTERLVRVTQDTTFVYENPGADNVLFSLNTNSLIPVCDDNGTYLTTCPLYWSRKGFLKRDHVENATKISSVPVWELKFAEAAGNKLRLTFDPSDILSRQPTDHPSTWIEVSASGEVVTLHLTPVLPAVKMSFKETDTDTIQSVEWKDHWPYETVLTIRTKPTISLPSRWDDNKFELEFKTALPQKTTIILDPGHGFHDSGACVEGLCEHELALKSAQLIRNLWGNDSTRLLLTREANSLMSLEERVQFAKKNNADLFVSLHFDDWIHSSVLEAPPRGTTCYFQHWPAMPLAKEICGETKTKPNPSWVVKRSLFVTYPMDYTSVLLEVLNLSDPQDRMVAQGEKPLRDHLRTITKALKHFVKRHQAPHPQT